MPWWRSNQSQLDTTKVPLIKDLTITQTELGRGSFGVVYAAVYKGKPCVVKEIHQFLIQHSGGRVSLQALNMEINTLSLLKHPSIVQFLGVHIKDGIPLLVMERLWRNLASFLTGQQESRLPLLVKIHILYDVACGLQYLHCQEKPIVHRDITANNVLLNENFEAKIADLGLAKVVEPALTEQTLSTAPGNISHMPPEATKHKPVYNESLDVFSFGCMTTHTITEKYPTPTDQYKLLENKYTKVSEIDRRKEFLDEMKNDSPYLHNLTLNFLQNEPTLRPAASWICTEFQRYIHELETDSPQLTSNYKQDKYSLVQNLQRYQSTEPNLEQQLQSTKAELEQLRLEFQQEKDVLQNQVVEKEELVQDMKAKIKSQNDLCQKTMQYSKDDLLIQSKHLLADCISTLSTNVSEKDDMIQELKQNMSAEMKEKDDKIEEFEQKTLTLSTKLKEKDDRVQELESETLQLGKIFSAERESCEQKISSLQLELSSSERQILSLKQTISLLQEDNDDYDSDNESFVSALEDLENEIDEQAIAKPTFTAHPSNVTVNVERNTMSVSLACEVDGATSYKWERQDGDIPSGATGVDTNTLILVDLHQHDTGNYRCVATNDSNMSNPSNYAMVTIKGQSMTISISKSLRELIIKEHANLRKYINMESLIPYLNRYEILTKGERNQLNMSEIHCQQKVDLLMQFLDRKSDESIQNFLKALEDAYEHTGHRQLLNILKQTQTST